MLGETEFDAADPCINLLHADLAGLPPISLCYGTDELLVDEITEFARRATAAGLDVSVNSVPGGQHVWLLAAGTVPETDAAIAELGTWLASELAVHAQPGN